MDLPYLNLTTYFVKVTVMISEMLLLIMDSYDYRATGPQGKRQLKLDQGEVLKPRRLGVVQ